MERVAANAELDQTFSALSDPTRRSIVALLCTKPQSAGALGQQFAISAPALSRHLKILRQQGLVAAELDPADHRSRIYRIQPEPLQELSGWLGQLQAQWRQQLEAFAKHVDARVKADS